MKESKDEINPKTAYLLALWRLCAALLREGNGTGRGMRQSIRLAKREAAARERQLYEAGFVVRVPLAELVIACTHGTTNGERFRSLRLLVAARCAPAPRKSTPTLRLARTQIKYLRRLARQAQRAESRPLE
jgi:hypothetical protein